MAFTDKQKAFIREYPKDFNATKAAIRAGYSERTAYSIGHENLNKPEIKEAIDKRIQQQIMSAEEAMKRLSDIAQADYSEFMKAYSTQAGVDVEALKEAGLGHLIREVIPTRNGTRVKLADPDWALELVLKHLTKGAAGTEDDPVNIVIRYADD